MLVGLIDIVLKLVHNISSETCYAGMQYFPFYACVCSNTEEWLGRSR